MGKFLDPKQGPYISGHRGASRNAPENTMAAFEKAMELNADLIELDVHLTQDDVPVVIHNHTVDETTNGSGEVRNWTWDQLKQLDAGGWFDESYRGVTIPALEDVLCWAYGKTGVSIELKQGPGSLYYPGLEEKVVDIIERTDMVQWVQVMSFDHAAVKKIKDSNPALMTSMIYHSKLFDPIQSAKEIGADIINTKWYFLDADIVRSAHDAGLLVCGSLCDSPEEWRFMQEWGVDMIDTNVPDLMQQHTYKRTSAETGKAKESGESF